MQTPLPTTRLVDPHGRVIDYLRVSVTDRCDLRCTYCLPQAFKGFEEPANWLSHEEMARLVGLFVGLGVAKVRLTGGEPLTRRALPELASRLSALPGLQDLSLSTNGTRLDRLAPALRAAGVQRLNISLDSLDADCVSRITGRDCLADVLDGIAAAREAGFDPIKLNMVVQPGVNDHEIEPMIDFACRHGLVLRLIEPMPVGDTGRAAPTCDLTRYTEALAQSGPAAPGAWSWRRPCPLLAPPGQRHEPGRHHAHEPAFLRSLQPRAPGRGRHTLPLPGAGRSGASGPPAARWCR